MEVLLKVLTVGGTGYIALLAVMFLLQGALIYFPDTGRQILRTPKDVGLDYEVVWLTTEDDVRIEAWFVPAPAPRGVALLAHGNAGNIGYRVDYARLFHRLGFSLLLLEYRGYGRSEGKPSEEGTYADARAAWRHLVMERGFPAERIVLVGESLGGAVVARLAVDQRPAALVLASSFVSVPELAAELYPWLPARRLARYRYDTLEALKRVSCPVLIAHSREDDIVPFHHGERLFAAVKGTKAFLEMDGGHNEGFLFTREVWREELGRFLEQHVPEGTASIGPR
ncbi:alpha/beta hydrolase [Noviherbaspirillum saxi]|uniref:Alpha/beta hydrolase n=1 Tax=Noviherbaspirillum saxi TaxID=2320863 RepID=A0A3A3FII7_9BURK|nr:alpha/beta hydrolase [Noviherbaspirillum saxi]RJF95077.1 alpha/beta hydrolase [Noviherbaspirillum saxi]